MTIFSQNLNGLVEETLKEEKKEMKTETQTGTEKIMNMDDSAKKDFFQNNKSTKVKYATTRIKSRNFLSNITYVGVNKEDYYNKNFILDIYLVITKNLNPFSLDRKLADKTKHEMIYIFWRECMPTEYYKFI